MSRIRKILVAYDGSPHSKEALNWAIDLSLMSQAQIMAVKVFEGNQLFMAAETGGMRFLEALEEMRREDARLMEEAADIGESRSVKVTGEILQGNIAAEIIACATRNHIDLIVTGTKGHGALAELLMGSVTRNLISLAHVPVLVVKD
jgi:nucleotide-binding universal stress UspA family protein